MDNGNESAFPTISDECVSHQWGLSKREYFAGLAMQGMLSNSNFTNNTNDLIAIWSIQIADSLLEQLNKQ
jgi:hypothetical protein